MRHTYREGKRKGEGTKEISFTGFFACKAKFRKAKAKSPELHMKLSRVWKRSKQLNIIRYLSGFVTEKQKQKRSNWDSNRVIWVLQAEDSLAIPNSCPILLTVIVNDLSAHVFFFPTSLCQMAKRVKCFYQNIKQWFC